MQKEYDLFELLPDGSPLWRCRVTGLNQVDAKLREIAAETARECFAIYLPTKEIVARWSVDAAGDEAVGGDPPRSSAQP